MGMIYLKTDSQIENIRKAGKIASSILSALSVYIKPGVTTLYIDQIVEKMIRDAGGTPSCKGYIHANLPPYPGSICISINEEAVHCIPSQRIIKEGDVVKVDLVVNYDGWNADTARTFIVPPVQDEARILAETCYLSMFEGIKKISVGNKITDVSKAIEDFVRPRGYGIVKEFIGHGIGKNIHEEPQIPNYFVKEKDALLTEGMVLCVEPILTLSNNSTMEINGWNTKSKTGAIVVHNEHTIYLGENGIEILTLRDEERV